MGVPRLITLRYDGRCSRCGAAQAAGTVARWEPATHRLTCSSCMAASSPSPVAPGPAGTPAPWPPRSVAYGTGPEAVTAPPGPAPGRAAGRVPDNAPPVAAVQPPAAWAPGPPAQRIYGQPGAGARRVYEARRSRERERSRRTFPLQLAVVVLVMVGAFVAVQLVNPVVRHLVDAVSQEAGAGAGTGATRTTPVPPALAVRLGLIVSLGLGAATALALWARRPTTEAWATGSRGEEDLGWRLDRLAGSGRSLCVVHDRRLPGSRANIDHLVVAPTGVHVVDAKRWSRRPEIRGGRGRRGPRLVVGGHDRTARVTQSMARQGAAVADALRQVGWTAVPVHPRVVLVGRGLGWLAGPRLVEGAWIGSAGDLATELDRPGPLADDQVLALGRLLADHLPPA